MDTKALRQKILDLAIRGKLVPQDPNDEPASVLLERIRAEKQQMVKDGKLKPKDIKNDTIIFKGEDNLHYEKFTDGSVKCIEDEIPFKLPQGWEWCRLGHIGEWKAGATPSRKCLEYYDNGNIPWVKTGDLSDDYINEIPEYITKKALDETSVSLIPKDTILIAMYGATIGKLGITTCEVTTNQACCACCNLKEIDKFFLFYFLMQHKNKFISMGFGGAQPNISKEKIIQVLMPVPPFEEQSRIVDNVISIFRLVETIENKTDDLKVEIQLTKSKILDLAIRGKLVPQDPNDEPASVLLERIRTEKEELIKQGKIKRDKKESVIFRGEDNSYYEVIGSETANIDEEIPFNLPDKWEWVRLGVLFSHNTGKTLNKKDTTGIKMTYITTSNLYWNRFELDSLKEMNFTESEIEKCTVQKGDLLVCEGGDIGRAAIWNYDNEIRIQNHIHKLRPFTEISILLYYYVFYYYKLTDRINGRGIGIQGLSSNQLHNIFLPLPPLNEQKRIADKVSQLFSLLDSIAENIN